MRRVFFFNVIFDVVPPDEHYCASTQWYNTTALPPGAICHTQVSVDMLLNMDIMLGSLLANSKLFRHSPFSVVGQGCLKPLLVMNVESYFKRFRRVKSSNAD